MKRLLLFMNALTVMTLLAFTGCTLAPGAISYTVTFDSQSATVPASPTNIVVTSPATSVVALPTAPTKTGYAFGGWYTATDGGGTEFTASTTVVSNITVYAKWNIIYIVFYNSDGGSVVAPQTVTLPATTVGVLPNAPTMTGYTFGGWYTATNGGGTEFTATTTVASNITVYAKWNSYSYTVTYNSDGGNIVTPQTVTSPATTVGVLPTVPTKTGYIFGGWYTALNGDGTEFTAATTVETNITVYAKWNSYSYTVTYNSDGGNIVTPQTVTSPATTVGVLPTVPTKTGYSFGGWYTALNGGGTEFTAATTVETNITVYAKWNFIYFVFYDSDGGSAVSPQTVTFPATTVGTLPAAPTNTGYNFGGWFTATNGGGTEFTASTTVNADLTVYADWIPAGSTWTARTLPSSALWYPVTYGNGVFVAIASQSDKAATSPDGITWTARTLPSSAYWYSVTYGNGVFVVIGSESDKAATSPDGITWTARTLPSSASWYSVTYGNGVFVAVTYGSDKAATSPDGITWTARTLPISAKWTSVSYGNGVFVAVT
ncbi:MAG: hypothetical protein HPY53_14450, partial [Brevinematales bacterium]|nr:hypothetical protein [Brevinematales bacterium]